MKKILPVLILGVLLVGLLAPGLASAQPQKPQTCCKIRQDFKFKIAEGVLDLKEDDIVGSPGGVCELGSINQSIKEWGIVCMLNTLYTATNWFFYVLIVLSTILIIWGAFGILFAAGDPEKMTKGRTAVIYAIAGVAIALFAKVIPAIVRFMMGV